MVPMKTRAILLAALLMLTACDAKTVDQSEPWANGQNPFINGKSDGWDWLNDPERFGRFLEEALEYRLEALPTRGETKKKAWPDTYWPTYQDSTNVRWNNSEWSPMEKYDAAFNDWVPPDGFDLLRPLTSTNCHSGAFDLMYYEALGPAARWQSENRGHWRVHDGLDNDGDGQTDECSDSDGIGTWWGLCHAWTPSSMLEEEPKYPVTVNGVTFYPSDLKALMITIYDFTRAVVIGGRCKTKQVERDENGRIMDPDCRDTNAGTFHIIMANFLGRYETAIAEDRTYNDQVWNQPVDSYEVDELDEISEGQAIALLVQNTNDVTHYPFNEQARRWAEVKVSVKYVTESTPSTEPRMPNHNNFLRTDKYHYVLEMDTEGLIVGGEWVQGGVNGPTGGFSNQPDFLWFPIGPRANPTATTHGIPDPRRNPHLSYTKVSDLFEKSQFPPN